MQEINAALSIASRGASRFARSAPVLGHFQHDQTRRRRRGTSATTSTNRRGRQRSAWSTSAVAIECLPEHRLADLCCNR